MKKVLCVMIAGTFLILSTIGCGGVRQLRPCGTPVSEAPGEYQPASVPSGMPATTRVQMNKVNYKQKPAAVAPLQQPKSGTYVSPEGDVRKIVRAEDLEQKIMVNDEMVPRSTVSIDANGRMFIIPQ